MVVDVQCAIDIARPRAEVATYACDLDHTTAWYANIKTVEWKSPRPLTVGSRLAFVATFRAMAKDLRRLREILAG